MYTLHNPIFRRHMILKFQYNQSVPHIDNPKDRKLLHCCNFEHHMYNCKHRHHNSISH
ncbi:CLUMA_CG005936, isoform A [Clunio marinus]|uniref:CLUMA_CG005936, isoform A n=1 Tax=Clunio marinus TaxID=568069 RepID=A0A1J1HWA3_9DIPT|nr:CLUMA_CG005936, isoform A [Clunio marinus]